MGETSSIEASAVSVPGAARLSLEVSLRQCPLANRAGASESVTQREDAAAGQTPFDAPKSGRKHSPATESNALQDRAARAELIRKLTASSWPAGSQDFGPRNFGDWDME